MLAWWSYTASNPDGLGQPPWCIRKDLNEDQAESLTESTIKHKKIGSK